MKRTLAALAAASTLSVATPSYAGVDPYIGEIMMVGFTFCPRGWAEANGQLLQINSNTALFSLYGTIYGGDGRTTFKLPDLRGRVPMHTGDGPGLSPRQMGQGGGAETNTLTANNLPAHSHPATVTTVATNLPGNSATAAGNFHATDTAGTNYHALDAGQPRVNMADGSVTVAVGNNSTSNASVNNMQPFLTVRYCIATTGSFPSRN